MVVTLPERPKSLRQIVEEMETHEGFRVEVIGGVLLMSPTPRVKHARITSKLQQQLDRLLPTGLVARQVVSVSSPHSDEDHAIPDLTVFPESFEDTEEWLIPSTEIELVVEVVSPSNVGADTVDKVRWYAEAAIPLYLLVDPRKATWRLHSSPSGDGYRTTTDGEFGEKIELAGDLNVTLATDEFKPYRR